MIADFGLAEKLKSPDQKLYRPCGSAGYVSPELIREQGYNCSTDIFSAGVIFSEMLTGRPLFKGSNPDSIFEKVINMQLDYPQAIWQHISEEALDLVKKMLAEDVNERITAEDALRHDWFTKDFSLNQA